MDYNPQYNDGDDSSSKKSVSLDDNQLKDIVYEKWIRNTQSEHNMNSLIQHAIKKAEHENNPKTSLPQK